MSGRENRKQENKGDNKQNGDVILVRELTSLLSHSAPGSIRLI
jgi:hypothetical protein